jgi:hypothetical protein
MVLRGRVVKKIYGTGTKSLHQAVCLASPQGDFKLRLPGADPFQDPQLDHLVGKSISAQGEVDNVSNQFFVSHWSELPLSGSPNPRGKSRKSP